ncbi:MAG: hypothetical protein IJI43_04460 [Bacilli bacterium]|nr:hypothetical protein [Bacilli bacterium]
MKAATGELSLTVITVVLIGFILGGFYLFWPTITKTISQQWKDNTTTNNKDANWEG